MAGKKSSVYVETLYLIQASDLCIPFDCNLFIGKYIVRCECCDLNGNTPHIAANTDSRNTYNDRAI